MADKIGFVGIGAMGAPMAMRLCQAGFDVAVCDVLPAKVDAFVTAHGGRRAKTPAEAAAGARAVFTSVINDRDVQAVTLGPDGIFAALAPGAVVVDHSTVSAKLARELAADAKRRGLGFIDAPVTISNSGAAKGKPEVMAGGDADAMAKTAPLMQAYASHVRHMGPSGAGQLCKMTLSFLMAGIMAGLNEGLTLGFRGGIAAPKLVAALMKTEARSWWLEARGPVMLDNLAKGLDVNTGRAAMLVKDLGLGLGESRLVDLALPLAGLVVQLPIRSGPALAPVTPGTTANRDELVRIVGRVMIALIAQALAEALQFVRATGQDVAKVFAVIHAGSPRTGCFDTMAEAMLAGRFDAAAGTVDAAIGDLAQGLDDGRRLKIPMPTTSLVAQFLVELAASGKGGQGLGALMARLGRLGGKTS